MFKFGLPTLGLASMGAQTVQKSNKILYSARSEEKQCREATHALLCCRCPMLVKGWSLILRLEHRPARLTTACKVEERDTTFLELRRNAAKLEI